MLTSFPTFFSSSSLLLTPASSKTKQEMLTTVSLVLQGKKWSKELIKHAGCSLAQ